MYYVPNVPGLHDTPEKALAAATKPKPKAERPAPEKPADKEA